jgi:uncharacterized protein
MQIDITFDPVKNATNWFRHGVSLELARKISWPEVVSWVDERKDYREVREVGLVPIHGRMFCVVFTRRDDALRIISLRRANNREESRYAGSH